MTVQLLHLLTLLLILKRLVASLLVRFRCRGLSGLVIAKAQTTKLETIPTTFQSAADRPENDSEDAKMKNVTTLLHAKR